jgi:hypothetical protein
MPVPGTRNAEYGFMMVAGRRGVLVISWPPWSASSVGCVPSHLIPRCADHQQAVPANYAARNLRIRRGHSKLRPINRLAIVT